ncbi:MAG: Cysteine export CydDC family transporter permease subunit/ATP-binding protein CydC, partial [Ilumatobacteraceae bacterium]|nr:Cysteine export CydDC family transporter permease subunit/ATP-binding protein CydC [Ilumatobacteraceae bacterium]
MTSIRRTVSLFGRQRWWIAATALLSFVTLGAGIGLISMSGYLISRSAVVDSTETLALAIVGVRAFAVLRAVGRYLERYVGHLGTFRILTRVRVWFFRGIEPLAPAALADERSGDVLTRIVDDVDTLQDLSLRVLAPPAAAVLAGLAGAVILGVLDPLLAGVLVAFLLVTGVVLPLSTRRLSRAAAGAVTVEQAVLNATTVESVSALADLVAYGREDLLSGRLEELTLRRRRAERTLADARGLSTALAGILGGLAALATLAIGVGLVADGRLDGVLLAVVPLATIATFEAVAPLAVAFEHLDRSRAASDRLFALVDQPPTVTDPVPDPSGDVAEPDGSGALAFDRVTFRYRPTDPDVLRDAAFDIPAGLWVGIVGASGSGKSTIPSLLLRFWEPQSGTIRLDGVDLR